MRKKRSFHIRNIKNKKSCFLSKAALNYIFILFYKHPKIQVKTVFDFRPAWCQVCTIRVKFIYVFYEYILYNMNFWNMSILFISSRCHKQNLPSIFLCDRKNIFPEVQRYIPLKSVCVLDALLISMLVKDFHISN